MHSNSAFRFFSFPAVWMTREKTTKLNAVCILEIKTSTWTFFLVDCKILNELKWTMTAVGYVWGFIIEWNNLLIRDDFHFEFNSLGIPWLPTDFKFIARFSCCLLTNNDVEKLLIWKVTYAIETQWGMFEKTSPLVFLWRFWIILFIKLPSLSSLSSISSLTIAVGLFAQTHHTMRKICW